MTDPSAAQAMRDQLVGDVEYMKDWTTDQGKQATLGFLRWVATGNPPELWAAPPETTSDVHLQESDRAQQQLDQHAGALRNQYPDLTAAQLHEITNRRPLTLAEKQEFQRQYDAKVKDEDFMVRWRRGDGQALGQMFLLNAAKALPIGTPDQIEAWEHVFPYPEGSRP